MFANAESVRRLRLLVLLAVFSVSLRWIPSTWCARRASTLWSDDAQAHRALARGADHWRRHPLTSADLMTGHRRFDGEWLFGTYMMAALGYAQSAKAHPERLDEYVRAMDDCIDHMLRVPVRAFDRAAWGPDPLDDLGSPRAHAAYLGYLNLVLSLRRVLAPDAPHAALNDQISAHLHAALARSPIGLAQTYPSEVYPVDNTAVIASLALHQRVAPAADHEAVLTDWDHRFEALRDPSTGLLFQALDPHRGTVVDGPRGSGSALAVYFLSFGRPEQSKALYDAMRTTMRRELLGFGAMREYPPGTEGAGDIDSGPVVLGVSISATGFSLAGSRIHDDLPTFTDLWATTVLFGAPVDVEGAHHFALGGPLGDTMMFALLTARPAGDWSAPS